MYVFLDFDGVLRRLTSNPSCFDPDCVDHFESAIRQCPDSRVVISSTWRLGMTLRELRSRFSRDVGARIIGVTPEIDDDGETTHVRYREICLYLKSRGIREGNWVAIDDDPEHYPEGSPVLIIDPSKGFDAECAVRLGEVLGSK